MHQIRQIQGICDAENNTKKENKCKQMYEKKIQMNLLFTKYLQRFGSFQIDCLYPFGLRHTKNIYVGVRKGQQILCAIFGAT